MRGLAFGLVASTALGLSVVTACGGSAENNPSTTGGRNTGGTPISGARDSGGAGGRASGGMASTTGGVSVGTGGSADTGDLDLEDAITDPSTTSGGDCKDVTLAEVMAQLRASHPELEDIENLWDPDGELAFDGSFIYAFTSDAGFRIIAARGWGDCEEGCINKEYWYFETGAMCSLKQVGHYSRRFSTDRHCFELTGSPMWGFPGALPPIPCGEDLSPQNVSGVHELFASGIDASCAGGMPMEQSVMLTLRLEVAQDSAMPGLASVVMAGTSLDLLNGAVFTGDVTGSLLTVSAQVMSPAQGNDCGSTQNVSLTYDFANNAGSLKDEYARVTDCATMSYCKGMLHLALTQ
jgi:hypothetical protein